MWNLGKFYRDGTGVEKDIDKAIELLTKAANLGCKGAITDIAWIYRYGKGVKINGEEAVKWYRRKNLIFPSAEALAKMYPVLRKCKLLLPVVWVLRWIKVLLFRRQNIRQNFAKADRLTVENIMNRKAELNYVGLSFNFKIEE